ncbi:MAG: hypothetical protein Q9181_001398 [Wetmoreana brouardii]
MSQLQGAWAGESDVFADAEERRVLFATLDSFRQYRRVAHFNTTHRRRQNLYALPSEEWKLLSAPPFNFLSILDQVDDAIDANADIATQILETGLESFGLEKEPRAKSPDWRGAATPADLDKARSTIRQLYRDWSAEGSSERQASYNPILHDFAVAFAKKPNRGDIKILVPGAGLGRLVFDLCYQGYNVEGNEVSYHQLLASNWVLNQTERAEQYELFPFASDFSNTISRAHQLKAVKTPDVHPATALVQASVQSRMHATDRMNMTAADFTELYGDEKHNEMFDAVATVFFLDTAPNVIKYIKTIHNCLSTGGIWANHGPLLWHWADRGTSPNEESAGHSDDHKPASNWSEGRVELSVEEVIMLVSKMGFEIEFQEIRREGCGYIQNPDSMLQHHYRTSHWTPKKSRPVSPSPPAALRPVPRISQRRPSGSIANEAVLMNSRLKQFGAQFGSKRTPNRNRDNSTTTTTSTTGSSLTLAPPTNGVVPPLSNSTSSTTSLPMNQAPNGLGRPPSYTYNPNAPRAQSPMPPPPHQQMAHHPPSIQTGAYPQGHPALGGAAQPPGYGGGYGQPNGMHGGAPQPTLGQYQSRGAPVEVEGAGRSKAQLIVGIDFGTTFSGVAFAFATNTEAKEDIITEWPGAGNQTKQKIPTVLYYDQYQKVVGWGPDIADALAPTGYPKPGVQKVEWFKLQLMLSGNTYIDPINLPPLPPGKSEIDVAADYLFKLRQAMRNQLQKTLGEVFNREERNIRYFLTVPAIWNDAGKAATRAAAIQAGFLRDENDNRLTLITEPEAAAMFCSKTGLLNLKIRDAVLIVDCGGGTVDLIAYEVEEETPFTVAECTAGSGDSCGSTALNRNFSNILRAKIRKMKLPDGSKTAGKVYAKCIMDFENRIKADFRNNGQKWAVDVGIEAEFPDAGIEEGYMTFTNEEILQCFEPVVNRILELVRNQIIAIQAQNRLLQNVLVVGGFGASEYLFQQIKLHVPPQFQSKVVRPMDSVAAIVKGAVTAGITERVVTSRVARRHYLMATLQPFKEGHHPEQYRVPSLDGKDRCKYTRQIFVQKGQRVKIGEPVKVSFFRQVAPGATLMYEDILYACDEDVCPEYTKDQRIKEVVTLTSDLSRKNLEKDFERMDTPQGTFYRKYFTRPSVSLPMLFFAFCVTGSRVSLYSPAIPGRAQASRSSNTRLTILR